MLRKLYLIWRYSNSGTRILNVGCGNLKIKNAVNVDIDKNVKPNVLADGRRLSFKDKVFDVAFAFDVVEHVENPEDLISELERVAKNVVIEVLDFDKCPKNWIEDPTHKYYFNEKIFRRMLEKRGYKCFKLEGYGRIRLKEANMLVAVKNPKRFDRMCWWIFFYLCKLLRREEYYRQKLLIPQDDKK